MARRRVPVLFCDETDLLVDLGVRLARKEIEDKSVSYLQPSVVDDASLPLTMQVYTCIPGIGVKTAETLYDRYPSVSDLLAASVEDLKEVSGVGAKTATEIHGSLRA
jgi:ERCC4-type nuclease